MSNSFIGKLFSNKKGEADFIPREVRRELKVVRNVTPLHKEIKKDLMRSNHSKISGIMPGTRVEEPFSDKISRVKNRSKNEVLSLLGAFKKRSKFDKELGSYLRKGPSGELKIVKHSGGIGPAIMDPIMKPRERSQVVSFSQRNEGVPIPRRGWLAADKYKGVSAIVQEEKEKYLRSRQKSEQPSVQPSKVMEIASKVEKVIKPHKETTSQKLTGEIKDLYDKPSKKVQNEKNFVIGAKKMDSNGSSKILSFVKPSPSVKVPGEEKGLLKGKPNKLDKKGESKTNSVRHYMLGEIKEVYK